jgi:hypothetical protein
MQKPYGISYITLLTVWKLNMSFTILVQSNLKDLLSINPPHLGIMEPLNQPAQAINL